MVFFTSSKCYKHQIILSRNDAQLLKSCRSLKIKFFQFYSQCYSFFNVYAIKMIKRVLKNWFVYKMFVHIQIIFKFLKLIQE